MKSILVEKQMTFSSSVCLARNVTLIIVFERMRQKVSDLNWPDVFHVDYSGHLHTEMFSCVFVLFQVMSWLFSIPLRTVNNTKTQENISVCTGTEAHERMNQIIVSREGWFGTCKLRESHCSMLLFTFTVTERIVFSV